MKKQGEAENKIDSEIETCKNKNTETRKRKLKRYRKSTTKGKAS